MSWSFEYEDKDGNKVNAGRPGWHIECSAMAHNKFGNSFDIHGGGEDLKFPHHECEIAQSKGSCGGDHARYWMHNAFINVDGEKMSKSLGNFKTIHSLLEKYSGEAIRLWMLSTHYRKPVDMTEEALDRAEEKLKSWYGTLYRVGQTVDLPRQDGTEISSYMRDSLSDDLNTPLAIAQIEGQMSSLNSDMTNVEGEILSNLMADAQVLGLLQQDPAEYLGIVSDVDAEVQALVEKRKQAKVDKDWALADSLKAEIISKGYELTDKAGGEVELRKVKPWPRTFLRRWFRAGPLLRWRISRFQGRWLSGWLRQALLRQPTNAPTRGALWFLKVTVGKNWLTLWLKVTSNPTEILALKNWKKLPKNLLGRRWLWWFGALWGGVRKTHHRGKTTPRLPPVCKIWVWRLMALDWAVFGAVDR